MRGLRSTLVLVVVLAGLVGYIYYLNGRESTGTDTKEKAFAAVKAEDIEDVQHQGRRRANDAPAEGGRQLEDRRAVRRRPLIRES